MVFKIFIRAPPLRGKKLFEFIDDYTCTGQSYGFGFRKINPAVFEIVIRDGLENEGKEWLYLVC